MPLPYPRITNAMLSPQERRFVRLVLRATAAYRKGAQHAGAALDSAAYRLGDSSANAHAVYHNFYTMWRDNGFSPAFLAMLLSFVS